MRVAYARVFTSEGQGSPNGPLLTRVILDRPPYAPQRTGRRGDSAAVLSVTVKSPP